MTNMGHNSRLYKQKRANVEAREMWQDIAELPVLYLLPCKSLKHKGSESSTVDSSPALLSCFIGEYL